ncbi:putative membrane protein YeiB [Lipingzhangella halophila]|uniref:Putative membrane protein YeiB n=1 Tax=Lipingzhangella halophila TaxID=1783352 RepID=A0A7W7RFY9_9ACTN|nr:DUF418 domain-containing protein [Lipingzhangella halophila]MBB4931240.1 putative membrane protein YeiB [Lipingzhangella halophila]
MSCWGLGAGTLLHLVALSDPAFGTALRYLAAPLLMLGYIGLIGLLLDRTRRIGAVVRSLRAIGRTALSCYVLQNVLASVVCYGWGLGMAEQMAGKAWLAGLWAVICFFLIAGSRLWLARFERGPVEAFQTALLARIPNRTAGGG